ncbi:MAG: hypothetical protein WKF31_08950 [Thermoleophilaceae bacterium]
MSNASRIGIVIAALVLAVAAFFVFRPDSTTPRDDPARAEGTRRRGSRRGASPARPEGEEMIRVAGGEPAGEPKTVSVESGDTVRLAFRSDAAGEVHIHGYDRYVDLKAGRTVRTRFPAEIEGIFEMEEHGSGALLGEAAGGAVRARRLAAVGAAAVAAPALVPAHGQRARHLRAQRPAHSRVRCSSGRRSWS